MNDLKRWNKIGHLLKYSTPVLFSDLLALVETLATRSIEVACHENELSDAVLEDDPELGPCTSGLGV